MTSNDLYLRVHDNPFRPFRIRMVNNTAYDIHEPWMVMVGESSAIIATQTRKDDRGHELVTEWKNVSIHHMTEFSDLDVKSNGGKRKKQ